MSGLRPGTPARPSGEDTAAEAAEAAGDATPAPPAGGAAGTARSSAGAADPAAPPLVADGAAPRPLVLAVRWCGLAALTALATLAVGAVGIPTPALFAGMLAGIGFATAGLRVPIGRPVVVGAEAGVGVVLGAFVQLDTVKAVGTDLVPIAAVSAATLGLSVLAGLLLARVTRLDRATAAFGMIAGGASGIIVIARELGADERLVAVMQYLRVLVVMALTPLVAVAVFGASEGSAPATVDDWANGPLFLVISAAAGLALTRLVTLPAPALLGPLIVAGVLTVAGVPFAAEVPVPLQTVVFAAIGIDVGLRFTPESLRSARQILLPALGVILALLLSTAIVGLALAPLAHVSLLDAYLATTPGGLYAVLGTAIGSKANTTFVLAVQVLRLFVMLLAAPAVARRLHPRAGP